MGTMHQTVLVLFTYIYSFNPHAVQLGGRGELPRRVIFKNLIFCLSGETPCTQADEKINMQKVKYPIQNYLNG